MSSTAKRLASYYIEVAAQTNDIIRGLQALAIVYSTLRAYATQTQKTIKLNGDDVPISLILERRLQQLANFRDNIEPVNKSSLGFNSPTYEFEYLPPEIHSQYLRFLQDAAYWLTILNLGDSDVFDISKLVAGKTAGPHEEEEDEEEDDDTY